MKNPKCIRCNSEMEYAVGTWICPKCNYQTTFTEEEIGEIE